MIINNSHIQFGILYILGIVQSGQAGDVHMLLHFWKTTVNFPVNESVDLFNALYLLLYNRLFVCLFFVFFFLFGVGFLNPGRADGGLSSAVDVLR